MTLLQLKTELLRLRKQREDVTNYDMTMLFHRQCRALEITIDEIEHENKLFEGKPLTDEQKAMPSQLAGFKELAGKTYEDK